MLMFLRKNWIHLAAWTGMLLYLVFANDLYVHFFLKYGKPVPFHEELPSETSQGKAYVDLFKPSVYDGQPLYLMTGWGFSTVDPAMRPEDYERQIVLTNEEHSYFFSLEGYRRPDVQAAFESYAMELTSAGFHAWISHNTIAPGTYRIGMFLRDPKRGSIQYIKTNKYLICTHNQIRLSVESQLP